MFDKKEYVEMFSQVTASPEIKRRVMTMNANRKHRKNPIARVALVAALIGLLAATASATERVQSWFAGFFAERSDTQLSQGQVEYIEENAQSSIEAQTHDGWTVELISAMNDNSTGYILLGITGPEGVDMTSYIFGNQGVRGHFAGLPDMLQFPEELRYFSWSWTWVEDYDGKANTRSLVICVNPNTKNSEGKPFGEDRVFALELVNIVREYEDEELRRELTREKQEGEYVAGLSREETLLVYRHEIIAEGTWEFEVKFESISDDDSTVQLISGSISTQAAFMRELPGGGMEDFTFVNEEVLLTGIEMDHLTVSFTFGPCEGVPDLILRDGDNVAYPCAVLKNGQTVRLVPYGGDGGNTQNLLAEAPLVYEEVDHLLMADGTVIPMPEIVK